ncbi:histidine ammonia-lyase [Feifania hominis]|uniref:Histidine ammonia-lyase n=1 Tax=Feifania hominis TaxID=2763660 RepID=A0A926HTX6_9FIRM|nr:histidine ammonia-lyase [Feifania hominis]MBC8535355.1 histidine ammonia-lyase [Feifania hominis]
MSTIYLDGETLSIDQVVEVARHGAKVELTKESIKKIEDSRKLVERFVEEKRVIYGINTGFGRFSDVAISDEELDELQRRLIYSDVCGIGEPFDTEIVRAMMVLRVNALAKGFSGIRLVTVQTLLDMINKGVHPIVREKGSVGSSGDLCPLSHMVLPLMGEGEAEYQGVVMPGGEAMKKAGITPVTLKAKEGLALINGTCAMMGVAVLAVHDALILSKSADITAALSLEALEGITDAYDPRVHHARPHEGQIHVAENLLRIVEGSRLTTHQGEKRVQDAYTLRCVPQIHGASRPALEYVKGVIETEINSATDNPLIFPDDKGGAVFSGGNFHGQPVAIAMDTLAIAMSEYANVSERRIERLLNPALSNGLPAFLCNNGGLNCGFMIPQYAAAAVVSENKVLAHPASVDSIPTSANQEDHVSMGTIAARKARTVISHVASVLGIELMCAAQGADFRGADKLGRGTKAAYDLFRKHVEFMEDDRIFCYDMDKAAKLIQSGEILSTVEHAIGALK